MGFRWFGDRVLPHFFHGHRKKRIKIPKGFCRHGGSEEAAEC